MLVVVVSILIFWLAMRIAYDDFNPPTINIPVENEFKTYITTPGGNETQLCFYPTRLDTYGRGCAHNCAYCYARTVLEFRDLWDTENTPGIDPKKVAALFRLAYETDKPGKHDILRKGVPLRIGSMSDALQPREKGARITQEVLEILYQYKHPYLLISKGADIGHDDYMRYYHAQTYVQTSVTTLNPGIAEIIEPGAATPQQRLAAIARVHAAGYATAVRINPMFPIYPDGWFSQNMGKVAKGVPPLPIFTWQLLDEATNASNMIIAGFARLSWDSLERMSHMLKINLKMYFLPRTKNRNTALHFSTEEKRFYYETAQRTVQARGGMFSVCYDGDKDYHKFKYLWHNPNDCCNGLGRVFDTNGNATKES